MTPWHTEWQANGWTCHPERYEARGIGRDVNRPRDLGDVATGRMVEIQHSPMSTEEFTSRNEGVNGVVWIFDATREPMFSYETYAPGVKFVGDSFRSPYPTSPTCRVLMHCADGCLYETTFDEPVRMKIGYDEHHVRMLGPLARDVTTALDDFFADSWPLCAWEGAPAFLAPLPIDAPIRMLSEAGRRQVDEWHRSYVNTFPCVPLTVVQAPPGAGKTTAIVGMIESWQRRAIVITFNKETSETMKTRLREAGLGRVTESRTLDSLCFEACGKPELLEPFTDWRLCSTFWGKSAKFKFGRGGPARRASNAINFRFKNPRGSGSICERHSRLGMKGTVWKAAFDAYPMDRLSDPQKKMTFASCRYVCDRDKLLGALLDKYDVVVVDEMQDLLSAQEMRLLSQTLKPKLMVGDMMQKINDFCHDPPCSNCRLTPETEPLLPPPIEWYGTWRLDRFTVRYLEEKFGVRMHTYRSVDERAEVRWQESTRHDHTMVLCRYNESVVKFAEQNTTARIVNGESLADKLEQASKDPSIRSPTSEFATTLPPDRLASVCAMLRERSVRLSDVHDMTAVSTVHQAKGFEYDHCAVHADLLEPTDDPRESCIRFVAFTRHRKSLVVLKSASPQAQEE